MPSSPGINRTKMCVIFWFQSSVSRVSTTHPGPVVKHVLTVSTSLPAAPAPVTAVLVATPLWRLDPPRSRTASVSGHVLDGMLV